VISLLKPLSSGKDVEISLVGDEGVAGLESILGAASSTHEAIVQVPGESLRVKPELLRQSFAHCGVLHDRLLRYTRYLLLQLSQTAACNRSHRLEERLARWILTVQDRAKRSVIPLTQEFLAQMLGSSRSEVTLAIGALRRARLLRYSRGKLTVVDRAGLEAIACECFHLIFEELENVEQEAAKARPPSRRFAPSPS